MTESLKETLAQVTHSADTALELPITTQQDVRHLQSSEDWVWEKLMFLENKLKDLKNLKLCSLPDPVDGEHNLCSSLFSWLASALNLAPLVDTAYCLSPMNKCNPAVTRNILTSFPDFHSGQVILQKSRLGVGSHLLRKKDYRFT